jgi:hypothetical protein
MSLLRLVLSRLSTSETAMAQASRRDCFKQPHFSLVSGVSPSTAKPWLLGRHLSRLRRRNSRPTHSEATHYSTQILKRPLLLPFCCALRAGFVHDASVYGHGSANLGCRMNEHSPPPPPNLDEVPHEFALSTGRTSLI